MLFDVPHWHFIRSSKHLNPYFLTDLLEGRYMGVNALNLIFSQSTLRRLSPFYFCLYFVTLVLLLNRIDYPLHKTCRVLNSLVISSGSNMSIFITRVILHFPVAQNVLRSRLFFISDATLSSWTFPVHVKIPFEKKNHASSRI